MASVEETIATLGEMSCEEIAAYLLDKGIKGIDASFTRCPIAVFLKKEFGNVFSVKASSIIEFESSSTESKVYRNISYELTQFILRFDARLYPKLEGTPKEIEEILRSPNPPNRERR